MALPNEITGFEKLFAIEYYDDEESSNYDKLECPKVDGIKCEKVKNEHGYYTFKITLTKFNYVFEEESSIYVYYNSKYYILISGNPKSDYYGYFEILDNNGKLLLSATPVFGYDNMETGVAYTDFGLKLHDNKLYYIDTEGEKMWHIRMTANIYEIDFNAKELKSVKTNHPSFDIVMAP